MGAQDDRAGVKRDRFARLWRVVRILEAHPDGMRAQDANWYEPSLPDLLRRMREWVYHPPEVEHLYRNWSMGEAANVWERELRAARERAVSCNRLL